MAFVLHLKAIFLLFFLPSLILTLTQQPSAVPFLEGVVGNNSIVGNSTSRTNPNSAGKFEISSHGIRALFVPYGAAISNIFVRDKNGTERDIVLGWDNASYYTTDPLHPHYGAVPGRYANRIKNASFTINDQTYHSLPNENNLTDTLHGGPQGWDHRNWTVVSHTTDSLTFSIADESGNQGFPGLVVAYVTYTLTPYTWHIRMTANSLTESSPIMLTSHTYWNLDAFMNPETAMALDHTLHLPYSGQLIAVDGPTQVPTGDVPNIPQYSVFDFWSAPKQLSANITQPDSPLTGTCGANNCTGYDVCFLLNRLPVVPFNPSWRDQGPMATLSSPWSGITLEVFTDQAAVQVYSCNNMNGTATLKETQGLAGDIRSRTVPKWGCIVLEVEDWIAGVNYPEWGRQERQIFGPGDGAYTLAADYVFSVEGQ